MSEPTFTLDEVEDILRDVAAYAHLTPDLTRPVEVAFAVREGVERALRERARPHFSAVERVEAAVLDAVSRLTLAAPKKAQIRRALDEAMREWTR